MLQQLHNQGTWRPNDVPSIHNNSVDGARQECGRDSIVHALDSFLSSVKQMKQVVMVPSRLQGVALTPDTFGQTSQPGDDRSVVAKHAPGYSIDAFGCYKMLDIISNELTCGSLRPDRIIMEAEIQHKSLPTTPGATSSLSATSPQNHTALIRNHTTSSGENIVIGNKENIADSLRASEDIDAPNQKDSLRRISSDSNFGSYSTTDSTVLSEIDTDSIGENPEEHLELTDDRNSISATIRMHLHGLFEQLCKLTDLAHGLTDQYQKQIHQ